MSNFNSGSPEKSVSNRAEKMFAKIGMAFMFQFIADQIRKGSAAPQINYFVKELSKKDLADLTPDERHKLATEIHEKSLKQLDEAVEMKV